MIFLSIFTGLTSLLPIFLIGVKGIFYSIDPEVMYVGNALSYIKIGQIQYIDHPGTPTIMLAALLLWPFRLYAKLVDHVPFVLWSFKHYGELFLYLRIWQGALLTLAVWIFLKAVKSVTGSWTMIIFSWLLLFLFPPFLRLGTGISPETLSFLLSSIWVWVLAKFLNKPDVGLVPFLGIISGLAVANKFTNLFLIAAATSLPTYLKSLNWRQKAINSLITLLVASGGFIVGTLSIRDKYQVLLGWVVKLVTSTGIHAGGAKAIFDWPSYWQAIITLHYQLPWLYFGLALTLLISIIRRKSTMLVIIYTVGVLVFAKYPLSYYQLSNYTVLVFLIAFLFSKIDKLLIAVVCLFFLPLVVSTTNDYLKTTYVAMYKTRALENYIDDHPSKVRELWEWGRAKTPALLLTMSSDWHGSIFSDEKVGLNLPAYELFPISKERVFDICWDQLYIQKISIKWFTDRYLEKKLRQNQISGNDDMMMISSDHCIN